VKDLHGEVFLAGRDELVDSLVKFGLDPNAATRLAITVANRIAKRVSAPHQFESISDDMGVRGLDPVVSRRVEEFVKEMVQQSGIMLYDVWLDRLLAQLGSSHFALATALSERVQCRMRLMLAFVGGDSEILSAPPLVLQQSPQAPVWLVYVPVAAAVLEIAAQEAMDWVSEASLPPVETILKKISSLPTPEASAQATLPKECFLTHYPMSLQVTRYLQEVAVLQWQISRLIGLMKGIDRAGLAWYYYAQLFRSKAPERVEKILRIESFNPLVEVVEKPTEELNIAGAALRHLLMGERLHIPAFQRFVVREVDEEMPINARVVVNESLVSQRQLAKYANALLHMLRGGRKRGLAAVRVEFLEAVAADGLLLTGSRARRGFWPDFVEKWNPKHPDLQLTPKSAKELFHSLKRKFIPPRQKRD